MGPAAHEFWTEENGYHDLAERFEQSIERTHPEYVTTRGMCACLDFACRCGWAATSVDYYEYRGEAV